MELKRTEILEIFKNTEKYIGTEIKIYGWIRQKRISKNVGFIEINDGSYFKNIQIVLDEKMGNYEDITKLGLYSSVEVIGKVVKLENNNQAFEVQATNVNIIGISDENYPLQNKRHSPEFLRSIAHLRPRTNLFKAVFKIRSLVSIAIHEFFSKQGFIYFHAPLITSSDAEGAGEMFEITSTPLTEIAKMKEYDYSKSFFGKSAHLTVSGQLNGEAFAHAFGKIYTFGPTFRAENSNTQKHAAEFWMIEPEMCFVRLDECIDVAENMIKYIIKYLFENAKVELEFLDQFVQNGLIEKLQKDMEEPFARCTYTEAIEKLKAVDEKFEFPVEWGIDLSTEHERYLAENIFKKPVFVTNYPKEIKAFYMKENEDNKTVKAVDLLVPGIGELIGGSEREENYEKLLNKMKNLNMDIEEYSWYLDLRKYGSAPHSGYGLGFERMLMYVTGVKNIRDVLPFPRTPNNCDY